MPEGWWRDFKLEIRVKSSGFEKERDTALLKKIYGSENALCEDFSETYRQWAFTAETPEEEREREGYATPEPCKKNVLSEIQAEIEHCQKYQRQRASIASKRTRLEIQRRNVPESDKLDRLLRYEASLERAFDRALNQLERIQRLRRGQPVPPRIDVNVST